MKMLNRVAIRNMSLPPLPPITGTNDQLPNQTDPVVVSTTADRLKIYADSDIDSNGGYVVDTPNLDPTLPDLLNYWSGLGPAPYTLTLRQYWRQVPGTYTQVYPGDGYTKAYAVTHGVSTTDSETLGAELGVAGEGLSVKLTASFSHSVTVSEETTEQTTYTVGAPSTGIRVWVLWQLVQEVVALDPSGSVLPKSVPAHDHGDVNWPHRSPCGAFLAYKNTDFINPSQLFLPQQADFAS
jgi:hypothetical protein